MINLPYKVQKALDSFIVLLLSKDTSANTTMQRIIVDFKQNQEDDAKKSCTILFNF